MSRLQRAGSAAGSPGSCPTSERRQMQREASAEALAMEYEQSAESGYKEVQSGSFPPCMACICAGPIGPNADKHPTPGNSGLQTQHSRHDRQLHWERASREGATSWRHVVL